MLFAAALVFLWSTPQRTNASPMNSPATVVVSGDGIERFCLTETLPLVPEPRVATDEEAAKVANFSASDKVTAYDFRAHDVPMREAMADAKVSNAANSGAVPMAPIRPPIVAAYESSRQKKMWYALAIGGHGAAVFDAWSTRRAVSGGYGTEANPLLRPFSHSGAMYAATQVSPAVMDYLGWRMMRSRHASMRRMWWLPQTLGAGFSFSAGVHNTRLAP